ncbi:MAG: hypothetical protein PQJ46_01090 [Spirochaetales bacterium]|nr:hypothetical protein [Spirochaetales bacterium]
MFFNHKTNHELLDYKNVYDDFSIVSYSVMLNGLLGKQEIDDTDFSSAINKKRLNEVHKNGIPWAYKKMLISLVIL